MVVSTMNKPSVKITVSDSGSDNDNEDSEYEADNSGEEQDSARESVENSESDGEDVMMANEDGNKENSATESVEDSESDGENVMMANEGWADSVAKILGSNKPKNKKTLVLSRAKKHSEVIKKETVEKPSFEVVGEGVEVKTEVKKVESVSSEPPAKKKKHEKSTIRVKPNILEKDRERLLAKIATKGVVQLFNAVRNQQKSLEKELDKDLTEAKKEKILKKFDKRAFLDTLMGQTKSIVVDEETKSLKKEVKPEEEKPKWNALRDDFMMGAKMKDWDKDPEED